MIKYLISVVIFLFSFSCFANTGNPTQDFLSDLTHCGSAVTPEKADFCPTFKSAAQCRCSERGYPGFICNDMKRLYDAMMLKYKSLDKACNDQHETAPQICMDSWNCYRSGGKDSQGRLCSTTGRSC